MKHLVLDIASDAQRREDVVTIAVCNNDDDWTDLKKTSSKADAFDYLWDYLDSQDGAVKISATFSQKFNN